MSWTSPLRHAARAIALPLVDTRATPNHVTTVRLMIGFGAIAAFAIGAEQWNRIGGGLFLLSLVLDKADGELARMSGKSSPSGRLYDMLSDGVTTVLTFVALGFGMRASGQSLAPWGPWIGFVAAGGIAVMYWIMYRIEELDYRPENSAMAISGFEPDDALIAIPIAAWLGWLVPLLLVAAVSGVIGSIVVTIFYRRMRRAAQLR